ncbi:16S rRNA processing protein RimM [Dorea sp. NSJ-36]|uniref:Ribosome maturation factor RimM n=1 Tax=Dorea hominis TaxID=2763040 RepID=A0ABR7ETY0_9FIRM|nr:ribosome maturation factor RimM [Dorea hominis]MBC5664786.1 16S rRNA processing protein RimM [Dorea hominis]
MEDMLQVGVITQTHGVRGEVKVFPTTDDVNRFKKLKQVILDIGKETMSLEIQSVKFFKQFVILKFKGIDNINDIEKYKRCSLYVTREHAVPLEEDEYFIADMIGMEVCTEDGNIFGTLKDVIETGANDVYVIESAEHGEVLVPAIKECIRSVDIEKGQMMIHLMDGLI